MRKISNKSSVLFSMKFRIKSYMYVCMQRDGLSVCGVDVLHAKPPLDVITKEALST